MAHYNKAIAEQFEQAHSRAITRVRDVNAAHSGRNMDRGFTEREIEQNISAARAALAEKEHELKLAQLALDALERELEAGGKDHYDLMIEELRAAKATPNYATA